MFKGASTLAEYQECIKRGLCEAHLKEISQNEHAAVRDEFPRKAFRFVRINILYPLLFKRPSKCEKIKRLMEKTPPIAKFLVGGDISDAADVILVVDAVVIFTLCQLSKICCIGALFHTFEKMKSDDSNGKAIQNLLLVERFEKADIRHFYPVLQENFTGCDLDIIRATHCITLLFIRKFCNKPNLQVAIAAIENDMNIKIYENTPCHYNSKNPTSICTLPTSFYSCESYMGVAHKHFRSEEFKACALFTYLAVSMDETSSKAYCLFVQSLLNLKLYEDALEVVQCGLRHGKKDPKFYTNLTKYLEMIKSQYRAPFENKFTNKISENSINNGASTDKKISIKKEKIKTDLVDLVDSDSAESDSESSKDVPELADAADSNDESETMGKKPSINETKEKTKNKSSGTTKKKRTISETSMDIQPEEEMDVNKINSFLKEASEALLADCGYKAVQIFRGPLRNFIESSKPLTFEECDIVCIKYSYGIAYCKSGGYDDIQKCITILKDIIENHDSVTFPAAHYSLGLAYRKLNRFKEALNYLEIVENFLCKGIHFKVYPWPGMTTVIQETKPDILKTLVQDLIKECENPPNPDAFCRYTNCSFQPTIYYTDPDFKGYISLSCSEQCNMQYHSQCWKSMKEEKNLTDKEFLEKTCFTPDCEGFIMKIQNIDKKGDLSKEFTSEFKKPSKQKWAKWEKKTIDIKEKEKKKKKSSIRSEEGSQEVLNENERVHSRKNSNVDEETASQFSGANGFIEETAPKSEIVELTPQKVKQNMKVHLNSSSNNICSSFDSSVQESSNVSPIADDVKKFDTELTQENESKFLLTECIKNNVYSFMADFLQQHGPLRIDDPILTNEMASFPDDAHEIISEYCGIGEFLNDDLRFACVGDRYVCVVSDLATAYKMFSSSSLPTDFKSFQPLEDDSKYYNESSVETRRSSLGLNPEAREYTPVVSSSDKSNSYKFITNNSLPHNFDSNFSLPEAFVPSSKCTNSLSTDAHLDTFPETEMLVSKSKSCDTVLNSKFQDNSGSVFCASTHLEQNDKDIRKTSDEFIYESELPSEPTNSGSEVIQESLNEDFSDESNSICISSEAAPVCDTAGSSLSESTSPKSGSLEAQLLSLLKQYYSDEMKDCRQSIDSSIKPYLIKEMTESASLGTMTDVKFLENNKDLENATVIDQENVVDGLKKEIYDLSKQNSSLQNVLECAVEQQQKLSSEVARLKKSSNESAAKTEILKKEVEKKEQDLLMGRKVHLESNASIDRLKKSVASLTEERNSSVKNVESLASSLKKVEENMKNALGAQEKKFTTTIQTLQNENAELKSKTKHAELQVLHMKKTEYLRRIEEKSLEAVERRKEMTMMAGNLNPILHNCMKMLSTRLISYANELGTIKLDFVRKIDEQIKKIENGTFLRDLKNIEMKELPVVPTLKNTFPNGPQADKSSFNSMSSSFNFGFNTGNSAQMSSAAITPPVASSAVPTSNIIPSTVANAKIIPPVAPSASIISPPTPTTIPSITSSMSSGSSVLEANKNNKMDISNDIDFTSLNPSIQESFKSAMASINSFASSPYTAPSLDDEFDKKCVVFKHPDPIPNNKPDLPRAPPGLLNSVTHSAASRAAAITPIPDPTVDGVAYIGEKSTQAKSYGSLDTVPKIKADSAQSSWELEKKKISSTSKNYEKLLSKLKEQFPVYSQEELISFVKEFRAQREGKLSGLPIDTIISGISAIIKKKKLKVSEPKVQPKSTKVLVNKKLVPDSKPPPVSEQQATKKKTAWNIDTDSQRRFSGNSDDDCTICCDPMTNSSAYKVACGHTFHENCIRQWLKNKSNCPVCRVLLLLPDEYPSLS